MVCKSKHKFRTIKELGVKAYQFPRMNFCVIHETVTESFISRTEIISEGSGKKETAIIKMS